MELDHIHHQGDFLGEEHLVGSGCFSLCESLYETWKSYYEVLAAAWSDLGRTGPQTAWQEPEALFFPDQPFLVGRAVRESHECLASAPLCVFPVFVIELFLSISGFFTHTYTHILGICLFLDVKVRRLDRIQAEFIPPCDVTRYCGHGMIAQPVLTPT